MFGGGKTGELVPISGTDPVPGPWRHSAFVPDPLPEQSPDLTGATYRIVANARAALAALDSTARQLPNPRLLRRPTLRQRPNRPPRSKEPTSRWSECWWLLMIRLNRGCVR